jgi:hypothetical protein
MRFTRVVLYRAGSCKVCHAAMVGDNKTVKPTIDRSTMIAHQMIKNKYRYVYLLSFLSTAF